MIFPNVWFFVRKYRFSASVTVFIYTDNGPSIYPFHGLQMEKTSVCTYILKMKEPAFSGRSIDPGTLMRPVYTTFTLCHYNFCFIRSVYVGRTLNGLPTGRYASCRVEDI